MSSIPGMISLSSYSFYTQRIMTGDLHFESCLRAPYTMYPVRSFEKCEFETVYHFALARRDTLIVTRDLNGLISMFYHFTVKTGTSCFEKN